MGDHKRRISELEKRIQRGEPIIMIDEVEGRWYWNGEETTEARIRASNPEAILLIDNIAGAINLAKQGKLPQ